MRLKSLMSRRPSAAIVISSAALFMSLGGVGYAAISIPNNSVGTAQLKNNAVTNSKIKNGAVTYKKINPGSVGLVRANTGQLQVRVSGTCATGTAIGTINQVGKVTCNNALPSEFGTTNNTATVTSTAATVTSVALPAGASYLAFANPTATVTSGAAVAARHGDLHTHRRLQHRDALGDHRHHRHLRRHQHRARSRSRRRARRAPAR